MAGLALAALTCPAAPGGEDTGVPAAVRAETAVPEASLPSGEEDAGGDAVTERLYSYRRNYAAPIRGETYNIYMKYNFTVVRRTPFMLVMPSLYYIARGSRDYLGETYGTITFRNIGDYVIDKQIAIGNISNYRKSMPIMFKYTIPDLYGASLFGGSILSPFNRENARFYKYTTRAEEGGLAYVTFRPRVSSTQLISGFAMVEAGTGRIVRSVFSGDYDMITFTTDIDMGTANTENSVIPQSSDTRATFKFAGNKVEARFNVNYALDDMLPDSTALSPRELMDSIRPDSLSHAEDSIYRAYYAMEGRKDSASGTAATGTFSKAAWDFVGDYMLNSTRAQTSRASLKLSPLLNPLYLSYSHSKGLSYKMKVRASYNFSPRRSLSLNPQAGYNFKIKKFFYTIPLRYTLNKKHDRWIELSWSNGNRITNSTVLDIIKGENRDTVDFAALNLDYFNDNKVRLSANVDITRRVALTVGAEYHVRTAENKAQMREMGKETTYRSFAPQLTLTVLPPVTGMVLTAIYERSVKDVLKSNTEHEKIELDLSFNKALRGLRQYSVRVGGGFYTNRSKSYFVDFTNFRENYLPEDADDWSGEFQLLDRDWYNASDYYFRTNISFASPLLALSYAPLVGRFIETERLYLSFVQIEHTRPYYEIGYGAVNRYFAIGVFGSFLNSDLNEIGCRFTFELFRNW